jgi:hypothetical protein
MQMGFPRRKLGSLSPRDGESAADDRLPRLSEECIGRFAQRASAELGTKTGSQVRLIRGFAAFLTE